MSVTSTRSGRCRATPATWALTACLVLAPHAAGAEDHTLAPRAAAAAQVAGGDVGEHAPGHTGAATGTAHGHYPGFLGVNWWAWEAHRPPMGWFLLDFGIFVGLLVWALKNPLSRVFSARHEGVKRTIATAAQAHARASHAHHDIRRRLAAMEAEIRSLENATVQDGEAERDQMVAAAEAYAARLRAEGQRQADQEVRRSEEHLRGRLLAQVVANAARKVQERITADDHARLLDEAITRLGTQGPKGRAGLAAARTGPKAWSIP